MRYEEEIQQTRVVMWFQVTYPSLAGLFYHIPNGQNVGVRAGARLKRCGLVSGVPDLHLAVPTSKYPGLYIEMKSEKGRCSTTQKSLHEKLRLVGYRVEVCHDYLSAQAVITQYLEGELKDLAVESGEQV